MKIEYFIGGRQKYGITLMETVRLDGSSYSREFYTVKWTMLTRYDGIKVQTFPMVRTDGEFYDFHPIAKAEYKEILSTMKRVSDELQPLLIVKRQIDETIYATENSVWGKLNNSTK